MAANAEISLLFHNRNEMLHLDHMYESTQTDEQYQMQYFPEQRKTELGDSFTQFSFGEDNLGNFDNDNNISFEQGLGESSDGSNMCKKLYFLGILRKLFYTFTKKYDAFPFIRKKLLKILSLQMSFTKKYDAFPFIRKKLLKILSINTKISKNGVCFAFVPATEIT